MCAKVRRAKRQMGEKKKNCAEPKQGSLDEVLIARAKGCRSISERLAKAQKCTVSDDHAFARLLFALLPATCSVLCTGGNFSRSAILRGRLTASSQNVEIGAVVIIQFVQFAVLSSSLLPLFSPSYRLFSSATPLHLQLQASNLTGLQDGQDLAYCFCSAVLCLQCGGGRRCGRLRVLVLQTWATARPPKWVERDERPLCCWSTHLASICTLTLIFFLCFLLAP